MFSTLKRTLPYHNPHGTPTIPAQTFPFMTYLLSKLNYFIHNTTQFEWRQLYSFTVWNQ